MKRCEYCGESFEMALGFAFMQMFGARTSVSPIKCRKAPRTAKRGPRGGIRYVREHKFVEVPT